MEYVKSPCLSMLQYHNGIIFGHVHKFSQKFTPPHTLMAQSRLLECWCDLAQKKKRSKMDNIWRTTYESYLIKQKKSNLIYLKIWLRQNSVLKDNCTFSIVLIASTPPPTPHQTHKLVIHLANFGQFLMNQLNFKPWIPSSSTSFFWKWTGQAENCRIITCCYGSDILSVNGTSCQNAIAHK